VLLQKRLDVPKRPVQRDEKNGEREMETGERDNENAIKVMAERESERKGERGNGNVKKR
jgi:hypothetical protein